MRRLSNQCWQLLKGMMQGTFRLLFRYQRQRRRLARSGFVFPTTMMMLLIVALTAGALTFRAYNRSTSAILARQQEVIQNAASPAIDRAKAKIEYLFSSDTRSPRRVPTSDQLKTMLLGNATDTAVEIVGEPLKDNGKDIYTLDDEDRVDLDGDGDVTDDNAWVFDTGVGNQKVVYSITIDDATATADLDDEVTLAKAREAVTRNGPINTIETSGNCGGGGQRSEEGWQVVSTARVQKNIQINAYLADPNDISGTVTTLELQQVREGDRASKWGAWFRYDLEMGPGADFNWNGATHTQGSLVMGERGTSNNVRSFMISSQDSCLYGPGASDMTVGRDISSTTPPFHGQLIRFRGDPQIDHDGANGTIATDTITGNNDSVATPTGAGMDTYEQVYLDPVRMYLEDVSAHIGTGWTSEQSGGISLVGDRVKEVDDTALRNLSLDDIFRADDRWGPKATYGTQVNRVEIPDGTDIGEATTEAALTRAVDGLDGFWERQATANGTRFIVGERLELGNAFGWNRYPIGDPESLSAPPTYTGRTLDDDLDPLYPPNALPQNTDAAKSQFGYAEQKQRKTLRDNLAAVQGMVVYRWDLGSGTTPQACIAVTAHHGTAKAVADSRTFRRRSDNNDLVMTDFLVGQGTDGWEFDVVGSGTGKMDDALSNLADFAGDPLGGAPSFEPTQDSNVHPYPYMAMWGDQALLRRVLADGNGSLADTSTVDAASCTLSLLAYNIKAIRAEHSNIATSDWSTLAPKLATAYAADNTLKDQDYTAWQAVGGLTANEQTFIEKAHRYWEIQRDRETGFAMGVGIASAATQPTGWTGTYDHSTGTYTLGSDVGGYVAGTYNLTVNPYIFNGSDYGTLDEENALSLALAVSPKPTGLHRYPALYYIFPSIDHDQGGTDAGPAQPITEPYIAQTVNSYGQNNDFVAFTEAEIDAIAATPKTIGGSGWTLPTTSSSMTGLFETDPTAWAASSETTDTNPFSLVVTDSAGANPTSFNVSVLDKIMYSGRENMAIRVLDMDVARLMASDWFYGKESGTDGVEHFGLTYAFREDAVREDEIVRPVSGSPSGCASYAVLEVYDNGTNPGCYMGITADALTSTDPPLTTDHKISLKPVDYAPDPDRRPYGFRLRNGADFGRADDEQSGLTFITDSSLIVQGDFNLHQDSSNNTLEEFTSPPTMQSVYTGAQFYNDPSTGRPAANLNLTNFANSANDSWRPAELLADAVYIQSGNFKDGFVSTIYVRDELGVSAGNNLGVVSFQNSNMLGDSTYSRPESVTTDAEYDRSVWREDGEAISNGGIGKPDSTDALTDAAKRSPIYFDRNGVVYFRRNWNNPDQRMIPLADQNGAVVSEYNYHGFKRNNSWSEVRQLNLQNASNTTVNALIVSGVTPMRFDGGEEQTYGGLVNFPRFNEGWSTPANATAGTPASSRSLIISGAFYQLFLSHTATAPFYSSTWNADDTIPSGDWFFYYQPPNRIWGYDVALQYSPPHPIAARFVSVGNARSEFYRELPVDDPYIQLLRCAKDGGGQLVLNDPNATCP
jgi:hypothetical protein